MSTVTTNWRKLEGRLFDTFVEKLSTAQYKELMRDKEFESKLNGHPFTRPETAEEEADAQPLRDAIAKFEKDAKELAIEMRDKLKRRLDASAGLTTDLINFFLNDAQYKNLPMMSAAGTGISFTPADKAAIKQAFQTFSAEVKREFTSDEQNVLLRTLADAGGLAKALSPMHARCWKAALVLAKTVGRISSDAATKKPTVNLEPAKPTTADLKRAYKQDVVFYSRKLSRDLTMSEIDALGSADYDSIIKEGFTTHGRILRNSDDLRPARGGR